MARVMTCAMVLAGSVTGVAGADPVRVLLVTGGHDFEAEPFFALFEAVEGIEVEHVVQPEANAVLASEALRGFEVIVFYDMFQETTEEQKSGLLQAMWEGVGVLALHHHLCSWEAWTEWHAILGGHYYQVDTEVDGEVRPACTYRHDVEISVTVADPDHPITRGVTDFTIVDEVYGGFYASPDAHVLLTTDHPESGRQLAWTTQFGEGRVAYLQLGHGREAYEHPSYQTLVSNAIHWAARTAE